MPHLEQLNQRAISWWSDYTCSHLTDSAQIWPLLRCHGAVNILSVSGHMLYYFLNCDDSQVILTAVPT